MAGVIGTGNHPKALWPGVFGFFGNSYDEYPKEWDKCVNSIEATTQAYEEVVQDNGFGVAPVKAAGTGIVYDSNVQGYVTRATAVTYGNGYAVTMEELADNLYEKVSMARAKALAFSHAQANETVVANVFNNGFSTSLQLIGDGRAFFSTTHPSSNGDFANKPATDVDLSEASLEDGLIAIAGFLNDKGQPIRIQPKMLMVGRQNEFNAARILKSVLQNDSANNAINAIRSLNSLPDGFMVNHYLTDTNAWFIKNELQTAASGLTFWKRMAVTFDKDNDFGTKNALASCVQRFAVSVADPRCYYGSSGSS